MYSQSLCVQIKHQPFRTETPLSEVEVELELRCRWPCAVGKNIVFGEMGGHHGKNTRESQECPKESRRNINNKDRALVPWCTS
jgi:hypothetical protein